MVISILPLWKVSSVYIFCRMGLRKIAKIFPGGLGIMSRISSFRIVFGMIFRVNSGKVHKVVGTEGDFNKFSSINAISISKCKLSVTEVVSV